MILQVYLKELRETLRDRRTVMMMIIIPTLIFPIVMNVFVGISKKFNDDAATKKIRIGLVSPTHQTQLDQILHDVPNQLGKKIVIPFVDTNEIMKQLRADSIDLGIYLPKESDALLQAYSAVPIKVFYNATDVGFQERAEKYVAYMNEKLKQKRYVALKIDPAKLIPVQPVYRNIASDKEMIGKLAGGILPYVFIAFGFLGCMYPAIDLFTGEKERGTMETLLTAPIARWKLLIGKMGVVVTSGLLASTFALLGLFLSIEVFDLVESPEILAIIHSILSPVFIITLFILLFPMTVFFAGIMIPFAIRAKSFKEAQSIISPLNIVVIMPAMVGFFPGIELNAGTAMIPIVNIVLASKELIAGTLQYELIGLSFLIMCVFAALMILFSYKRFGNETDIVN